MINSSKTCVAADIIIRVIAPDPDINVQQHWQDLQQELVAPTLLRCEVTNLFHRMRLQGNVDDSLAKEIPETALELPITFYDDAHLSLAALNLARRFDLKAAYDAHYLAVSEHLGCELWTTDKKSFNGAQAKCDWVRLAAGS